MKQGFIGINRLRIGVDGKGVTTLAAFHGCPLRCRYCLNPLALKENGSREQYSPEELFEKLKIDDLYFVVTDGGVTFGGDYNTQEDVDRSIARLRQMGITDIDRFTYTLKTSNNGRR